jgi:hypothetical protein
MKRKNNQAPSDKKPERKSDKTERAIKASHKKEKSDKAKK